MKIKIFYVEKMSEGDKEAQLEALRNHSQLTSLEEADVIYCASIGAMNQARLAKDISRKPLAVYCWDYYLWAHEGKHYNLAWNWGAYADMLRSASVIFVPSKAQQLRLKELLGLDSIVVKSGFPTYDMSVTDEGFILDPVRYYENDPNVRWAEKAANELGIKIIHSEHQYSLQEFRKLVASCTFMTSCYVEASTGGLTIMEGLWLGKQTLYSNSVYNGASDYLGSYGFDFKFYDYEDLKRVMKNLWDMREQGMFPTASRSYTQEYINRNFGYDKMAREICEHLTNLKSA